jgi:chemotaxis signal transduction protein
LVKGDAQLGLLADRIEGVVGLEPKKLHPLEKSKERVTAQRWPAKSYFKRGKRIVPLIDVERLAET